MNEVELIRAQLAAERRHATEVANACATYSGVNVTRRDGLAGPEVRARDRPALDAFRQACVDYLVWVLARFEERDQLLADLLRSRLTPAEPAYRALEETLQGTGKSREALEKLEAALALGPGAAGVPAADGASLPERWQEFLHFFNGPWSTRRDALDQLAARSARVTDWRAISLIDADSILEERNRYARVQANIPAGLKLRNPDPREPTAAGPHV